MYFIILLIAGDDQKFREYLITDNEEKKQPNKGKEITNTIYENVPLSSMWLIH